MIAFELATAASADLFTPEQLASGDAFELYSRLLLGELFEQEAGLFPLLAGGYYPVFASVKLEHYAFDTFFDEAVCRLQLGTLGAGPLLCTVRFIQLGQLVTVVVLHGRLTRGCS